MPPPTTEAAILKTVEKSLALKQRIPFYMVKISTSLDDSLWELQVRLCMDVVEVVLT